MASAQQSLPSRTMTNRSEDDAIPDEDNSEVMVKDLPSSGSTNC